MRALMLVLALVLAGCQASNIIGTGPIPNTPTVASCIEQYNAVNGSVLAISTDGTHCAWVYCPDIACSTGADPMVRAVHLCEQTASTCKVHSYNKDVVWKTNVVPTPTNEDGTAINFLEVTSKDDLSKILGRRFHSSLGGGQSLSLSEDGVYAARQTLGDWWFTGKRLCLSQTTGPSALDVSGCYLVQLNSAASRRRLTEDNGMVRDYEAH